MHRVFRPISILAGCAIMLMVTACNGIFDDIYDEASASSGVTTEGQLLVNAGRTGIMLTLTLYRCISSAKTLQDCSRHRPTSRIMLSQRV